MSEINLLSGADAPKEHTYTYASQINKLLFGALGVFVLVLIASIFITVYNRTRISSLTKNVESLRDQVQSLSDVENKYAIAKNRAGHIRGIIDSNSVYKGVQAIRNNLLTSNIVEVRTVNMRESDASLGLVVSDIQGVRSILDFVLVQDYYNNINVSSLEYAPGTGYTISLDMLSTVDINKEAEIINENETE